MIIYAIVDVFSKNVDMPYKYNVSDSIKDVVEIGMRISIPFNTRTVLGFIVKIEEGYDDNLKYINEILDFEKCITKELLTLSHYIRNETNSFYINVFYTMLPNALRVNYLKKLKLINKENVSQGIKALFKTDLIELNKNIEPFYSEIKEHIKSNDIEEIIVLKDKVNIREITYIKKIRDDFPKIKRPKQIDILNYLKQDEYVPKSVIAKKFNGTSSINTLIKNSFIKEIKKEEYRKIKHSFELIDKDITLNSEQEKCFKDILKDINEFNTHLLYGVTGSGKTEIYLNLIEEVVKNGKEAIMLVPEISLTPMIIKRFKSKFNDQVAVMHSGLSNGERYDEFRRILRGEVKIVVGARSAIFAPFENLGIIIIDEEQTKTYKQDTNPRYHTIDVAKKRAKHYNIPVILGSATPSIPSYTYAINNIYKLHTIKNRANKKPLPKIEIVDMTNEVRNGNMSFYSKKLIDTINEKLDKDEQIIILLNRRGHSSFVLCRECGEAVMCPNCDVSLTYHEKGDKLKCHYCNYEIDNVTVCPTCLSKEVRYMGIGTQKLESDFKELFKGTNILRMDVDTTTKKNSHELILEKFENKEANILIGTQMIAKGLDFKSVTLVGVISADASLKLPTYTASEDTFSLLSQVAGRAGRHSLSGEVIIQTYNKEHYAIESVTKNDYIKFYEEEIKFRQLGKYPPYFKMIQIVLSNKDALKCFKEINKIFQYLKNKKDKNTVLLGPAKPSIGRVKNQFKYQILIKYRENNNLKIALRELVKKYQLTQFNLLIDKYPNIM